MNAQADGLSKRLRTDAELRQRIAAAHRAVLDDAGVAHHELSDDELTAITGGVIDNGSGMIK